MITPRASVLLSAFLLGLLASKGISAAGSIRSLQAADGPAPEPLAHVRALLAGHEQTSSKGDSSNPAHTIGLGFKPNIQSFPVSGAELKKYQKAAFLSVQAIGKNRTLCAKAYGKPTNRPSLVKVNKATVALINVKSLGKVAYAILNVSVKVAGRIYNDDIMIGIPVGTKVIYVVQMAHRGKIYPILF